MKSLTDLASIADEAISIAGSLLAHGAPGVVSAKSDRDLVSELDLEIERRVRKFLAEQTPECGFLGEEEGGRGVDYEHGDFWAFDPIDGTSNFTHGLPLCATSLALIRRGSPAVGVIDAPFLSRRYRAVKSEGSTLNGERIRVSDTDDPAQAIVSIGDYATGVESAQKNSFRFALTQRLVAVVERVRMFGSAALDLAFVADGSTDAMVMTSNKTWDTAAGVLIAAEAGATLTDIEGAAYTLTSNSVIARTPKLVLPIGR
ncbi:MULTISPECIES: inositol monophosphatase family protein [Actinoalloteichus]|uniref:Inositol-1-monophosphatase n=1 Tax=Actinoalloteichus fjordicus TaxID=1612552 RepID=A0AAC9L7Q5_9PSEU|nr:MULTISPECIES: inositol monophosphatase family protein [Actinoalloteichus]APU12436.1 inositol monophosphatase/fructose-1,6-bisphosphatase family protein [Actinoalloteichus fjordicus]APU18389.1 inositol monophosphatase/fructose-1,6-bisphosphatase family protein [Actinoalloteichus sp. GBA129-24]